MLYISLLYIYWAQAVYNIECSLTACKLATHSLHLLQHPAMHLFISEEDHSGPSIGPSLPEDKVQYSPNHKWTDIHLWMFLNCAVHMQLSISLLNLQQHLHSQCNLGTLPSVCKATMLATGLAGAGFMQGPCHCLALPQLCFVVPPVGLGAYTTPPLH